MVVGGRMTFTSTGKKTARVSISYSKAFPGRYNIYTNGYVNGSWGDYTQRPAVVPGVGEYLIYNTIYESNGYERTYARLGGFRAGGGTASGLWSPDSVGSYPHINP